MSYESKYPSRHKPGTYVTVGQWLGELMCERKALRETKELPRAFWLKMKENELNIKWSKYLKLQTQQAYKLIKEFGEDRVVESVTSHKTMYSLLPKWVKKYITDYKMKPKREPKKEEPKVYKENPKVNTNTRFRKKNILDILEEEDE